MEPPAHPVHLPSAAQDISEATVVTVSAQFKPILLKILMQAPDVMSDNALLI